MIQQKKSFAEQARDATKAVVRIHVQGFSETDPRSILDPRFVVPEEWSGSGFFINHNGEDGYILTNSHVARNSVRLQIRSILTSDEPFNVEVLGIVEDLEPDVALLRLTNSDKKRFLKYSGLKRIPALKLGFSVDVRRGDEVKTIGYPLGVDEPHFSGGEISNFIAGSGDTTERMVTDAAINLGNSGGPALVRGGWVVGINTAVIEGAENFGFITPIHLAKNVLDVFSRKRKAGLPRLGVLIQKNSAPNAASLKTANAEGVIVRKVLAGSPAEAMGLKARDLVLAINNENLDRHGNILAVSKSRKRNIYDILHGIAEGKPVSVKIDRAGKILRFKKNLFYWNPDEISQKPVLVDREFMSFGGLILQEVCADIVSALISFGYNRDIILKDFYMGGSKLVVTHVSSGSLAEEMGLYVSDFVVAAQREKVRDLKSFFLILHDAKKNKQRHVLLEFASGAIGNFEFKHLAPDELFVQRIQPTELKI
ncbi:S1C family serine protease [Bdellovibrio svalbardensis]|uniref:Trypsin-like peptidase domain-containing protein n=1 Tax=Bdellovibrio svalbardensis TaxID=2972972 RepID=A0ABT6DNE7_9BACT|nr:trypsin-like peptidase domain-containing protein [Bdellovibrio svalbardensis]MDG0818166.1 trypsin-like peptidase domain-containing protein [Bdellovibrio svalbardensis]